MAFDNPRGYPNRCRKRGNISDHNGPTADNAVIANPDFVDDRCADPYVGETAHSDSAAQLNA